MNIIEECDKRWCISVKLMFPPIYVCTIHKPKFEQSPYFKTRKDTEAWADKNHPEWRRQEKEIMEIIHGHVIPPWKKNKSVV